MIDHDIAVTIIRDNTIELLERGWIQGNSAHDELNYPVWSGHPAACKWCLTGAINKAILQFDGSNSGRLHWSKSFMKAWFEANEPYVAEVMEEYNKDDQEGTAILFNDKNFMTQEQVVASLKRISVNH